MDRGAPPRRPLGSPMPERAPRSAVAESVSAGELASLRRRATGSAADLHGQSLPGPPVPLERRRRGRDGARAIQTIPQARRRGTAVGRPSGAPRPGGGAPEHRPSVSLCWE